MERGVQPGKKLGQIDMRAIASTLAKIMGFALPDAEARPIDVKGLQLNTLRGIGGGQHVIISLLRKERGNDLRWSGSRLPRMAAIPGFWLRTGQLPTGHPVDHRGEAIG
jgi:hypothetical protein